jgi:hypothetical protein
MFGTALTPKAINAWNAGDHATKLSENEAREEKRREERCDRGNCSWIPLLYPKIITGLRESFAG